MSQVAVAVLYVDELRSTLLGNPCRRDKALDDSGDVVVGQDGMIIGQVEFAVENRMAVQNPRRRTLLRWPAETA